MRLSLLGLLLLFSAPPLTGQPPVASPSQDRLAKLQIAKVQEEDAAARLVAARKAKATALAAAHAALDAEYGDGAPIPPGAGGGKPLRLAPAPGEAAATTRSSVAVVLTDAGPRGYAAVVDRDTLLTCANVVGNAETVKVRFPGGVEQVAQVLAISAKLDLAVLRAASGKRAPLVRAESVQVGDRVAVAGDPAETGSVTTTGKTVTTVASGVAHSIADVLLTDATISPGSSGLAVVNARGELVGLACVWRDGTARVGFVIPASHAATLLKAATKKLTEPVSVPRPASLLLFPTLLMDDPKPEGGKQGPELLPAPKEEPEAKVAPAPKPEPKPPQAPMPLPDPQPRPPPPPPPTVGYGSRSPWDLRWRNGWWHWPDGTAFVHGPVDVVAAERKDR